MRGGNLSQARAINDAGEIVGLSRPNADPFHLRAVVWCGEQIFNLNDLVDPPLPLNIQLDVANDISNDGSIIGYTCNPFKPNICSPGAPPGHGFLLIPNG